MKELERQIRAALGAGRIADATPLVEAYRRRFDEVWAAMSASERRASPLVTDSQALFEWAMPMTLACRAAAVEQLRAIRAGAVYRRAQRGVRTWQRAV
jgi:hypothetical protein